MQIHQVKISREGRVLIPADVRESLGLKEGVILNLAVEGGEIRLFDQARAVHRAQELASKYKVPGRSIVDEFIAEQIGRAHV